MSFFIATPENTVLMIVMVFRIGLNGHKKRFKSRDIFCHDVLRLVTQYGSYQNIYYREGSLRMFDCLKGETLEVVIKVYMVAD